MLRFRRKLTNDYDYANDMKLINQEFHYILLIIPEIFSVSQVN